METIRAFIQGLREWAECVSGLGRTYSDPRLNEAYDRGVNAGERLHHWGRLPSQH
jgi:hypothetical protein